MMILAIVQARMGSTRLPGKVLKKVQGKSLISLLLGRLSGSQLIDRVVVATTDTHLDDQLTEECFSLGYDVFRGSENDVLSRYYYAAEEYCASTIVRITGDCPLIDCEIVDQVIRNFHINEVDYASNIEPPSFPDGLDVEVFSFNALRKAFLEANDPREREHVTTYLREQPSIKRFNYEHGDNLSHMRWTVDDPSDFIVIENIFKHFSAERNFTWIDVLLLSETHPSLFEANADGVRNMGSEVSKGQKLWGRAKRVIPGGNMLLSKRPEMFLPDKWPAYFDKAQGCEVWDLEGKRYIDMSIMGVGTNILGYGHPKVDDAVRNAVQKGNMSTLNCPEEVHLAERLVDMHPWSEMVKFARSGGEANAIAIRIARAATGKDNVAICGYHGWHDWYLATNLGDDDGLTSHLLPGLQPMGVPKGLSGTVFPFQYNNYSELEKLVAQNDIGVIKMEVVRNFGPDDDFLSKVRKLADENNIVLIFDECTSGFRETFGGIHKKYGVEPDMAMFGKAMGNGYAITAVVGRRSVMESAQSTFISSTFWTERIGPSAALAALDVMEELRTWETITEAGNAVRRGISDIAQRQGLEINHWGIPALCGYSFLGENANAFKTLVTQDMLSKGYLVGNSVYLSIEHTPNIISDFLTELESSFSLVRQCMDDGSINASLQGPVAHSGFKRLN
ncbi:MAG: aminotransferase class III-fold pyridoxal phosphate-dependent enzyme [Chloroflexota bacterium]|nr:aminotransferase class III-fold pyridoxal phosphate-dependent enzyme [Chloroflexota bacterium]